MKISLLSFVLIMTISMGLVGCGDQDRPDKGLELDRQERNQMHERDVRREMERHRDQGRIRQEHDRMEQGRIRQEFQDRMRRSRADIEQARKDLAQREATVREKSKQLASQEMSSMTEKMSGLADQIKQLEIQATTLAENIAILTTQVEDIASRESN